MRISDWSSDVCSSDLLWALGLVSFAEASFFPIPPDPVLAAIALARRERAWIAALVCTLASVAGGLLGYAIGAFLYETLGQWLITVYHPEDGFRLGGGRVGQVCVCPCVSRWLPH